MVRKPSKITVAARALSDLAHELGPDAKLPTVAALREQLGVSVVTLNEALNEAEARQLIERRHGVGIYVSSAICKGVALACAPKFFRQAAQSPFWDLLIAHSEERAARKHEAFSFHFEPPGSDAHTWDESSLGQAVATRRVQGVIAVGLHAETIQRLEEERVPVVNYAGPGQCQVNFDGGRGVEEGTRTLMECGCRRIELWLPAPDENNEDDAPRVPDTDVAKAFKRVMPSALIRRADNAGRETLQEQGLALAQHVFGPSSSPASRPDGVVLSNDLMAHGALTGLQKLGVRPGREVQIATHANAGSPMLLGHDDILLIENDPAELAAAMFNLLRDLMVGDLSLSQSVAISLAPRLRPVGEHAPHPSL